MTILLNSLENNIPTILIRNSSLLQDI